MVPSATVARAFSRTAGCDETEGGHKISVESAFAGGAVAEVGLMEVSTEGGGVISTGYVLYVGAFECASGSREGWICD